MKKLIVLLPLAVVALLLVAGAASAVSSLGGPSWADLERERLAVERAQAVAPVETFAAQALALAPVVAVYALIALGAAGGALALVRFRQRSRFAHPDAAGRLPVLLEDGHAARVALAAYHEGQIVAAGRQPVPQSVNLHYAPHYRADSRGAPADAPELPAGELAALPGVTDLASLGFRPTAEAILLGLGPGGERITVPARALCHVALVGATGGGKSNLLRLILPQLQAIGARVCLADPHFAPLDPETGEDWRPIAQRLHVAPAVSASAIDALLAMLTEELDRRLALRHQGQRWGPSLFLALDELPVIADTVPGAVDRLGRLLREGRKVGVLSVGAAQTMLVKAIGGDSSAREGFRTAFYVGGDLRSAAALLDLPQREIAEEAIGGGVAYLRSAATAPARLVRVPLASNAAVAGLLGDGGEHLVDFGAASAEGAIAGGPKPRGSQVDATAKTASRAAVSAEAARVLALFHQGLDVPQIVKELRGIDPGRGGGAYQQAARDVQSLLREAMRGGAR